MKTLLIILFALFTAFFIFISIKEYYESHSYKTLCISVPTFGLVVTAIYGFYVTSESTRTQTSMDFCLSMFKTFQSKEYIERERLIWKGLEERGNNYCAIEDIEDSILRNEIYEYCEILNGVGVLVLEHMINTDMVVAYLGTNTLKTYSLIEPYLDMTRKARCDSIPEMLPIAEKVMITEAETMAFAYFELLVLEMKRQAPIVLVNFQHKLKVAQKKENRIDNKIERKKDRRNKKKHLILKNR